MFGNISAGIKNRYQMLTKKRPKAECNTTAATMGALYTGYDIPVPEGMLPEDFLMSILDSDEGRAYLQSIVPGAAYNPWNDSNCIAWVVNKVIGKEVCKVVKVTIEELITHVKVYGGAVVIGGGFLSGGTTGHFVCVVDVIFDATGKVTHIVIDDPYGNFNKKYVDHFDGNDIPIDIRDFIKLTFGTAKRKTVQLYTRAA